ncbi:hypothetical protein ABRY23_13430 [Melioribacteraceae bacterium 4301-Me]|uniref:hypothetical protein n=1 Tax=Pyranulibacter aquaticus TaxID=3163344 RepID=UPI00359A10E0
MGGKAAILLVLGFSLIFLVAGSNFNRVATTSVDNLTSYYDETAAYNLASAAANMACNRIFLDPAWTAGYNNMTFGGGTINVTVEVVDPFQNIRKIIASGIYDGVTKQIQVTLQPSKFSKFTYYSAQEPSNIWWTTGDTVWGPLHIQGNLQVAGSPVFWGKVTNRDSLVYFNPGHWETRWVRVGNRWRRVQVWVPGTDDPKFYGGYENGVDIPMPTDGVSNLRAAANSGGAVFTNKDTVYLTFQGDSLKYKFRSRDKYTSVLLSTFAPNGVIFVDNGNIRLKGTIKGQYTVGASATGNYAQSKGKVFLDDDVVYNTDPRTNPSSTDLFGIVTQNEVLISDNLVNRTGIKIDASIYSEQAGFGAENYDTRVGGGFIDLYGGIQQKVRKAVGTFDNYGVVTGFNKRYRYDERLRIASPPYFPGTGSYQIVSWYE